MGDRRRFSILAEFISQRVDHSAQIADVAAGKGRLTLALHNQGFNRITPYEPFPRKGFWNIALYQPEEGLSAKALRRRQRWSEERIKKANNGVKLLSMKAEAFEVPKAENYDVIVGLHPDGATEEIICGAAKYKRKMFLVPCCARTSLTTFWGNKNNYYDWIGHLLGLCEKNDLPVEQARLPMSGRNIVLWTP